MYEELISNFGFLLPDRKFLTSSQTNTYLNFWRQNLDLEQQGMIEVCLFFVLNQQESLKCNLSVILFIFYFYFYFFQLF